jgi:hypothetical protein
MLLYCDMILITGKGELDMCSIGLALLSLNAFPISLEIGGGGVFQTTPETTTPGMFWEAGISGELAGEWHAFASMLSWSSSNFDPEGGSPPWVSDESEIITYQGCKEYQESRQVLQLGIRRSIRGIRLGLSGGVTERVSSYSFDGDIDGPTEFEFENRCFTTRIGARAMVGETGYIDLSATSEELESLVVSLSFGTSFRIL